MLWELRDNKLVKLWKIGSGEGAMHFLEFRNDRQLLMSSEEQK